MYNQYNSELQKNSGMVSKFDDEMINIKGRVLRNILRRVADFSATNYEKLRYDCEPKWSFNDAFFIAGTIGEFFITVPITSSYR